MKYIGVDPGESGAIAIIHSSGRIEIFDYQDKKWEEVLRLYARSKQAMKAIIEDVHNMPGQDISHGDVFMKNAGEWRGWMSALEIPFEEKAPISWMNKVLGKRDNEPLPKKPSPEHNMTKKEIDALLSDYEKACRPIKYRNKKNRKAASLDFARRKFPQAAQYLTRVKDHDRAEALLIAYYCQLTDTTRESALELDM